MIFSSGRAYLHRVTGLFLAPIIACSHRVSQRSYDELVDLDQKLRAYQCPAHLRCPTGGTGEAVDGLSWSDDPTAAMYQLLACVYLKEACK